MPRRNALLDPAFHVRWSAIAPDTLAADARELLALGRADVERIKALAPAARSFESVFIALERATERVSAGWSRACVLKSTMGSPEYMAAFDAVLPDVTAFFTGILLDADVWAAVRAAAAAPGAELGPVQRRLVDETLKDFREAGADLGARDKARLAELIRELTLATSKYAQNMTLARQEYELVVDDAAQLAGLPERVLEQARESAQRKGLGSAAAPRFRFTLDHSSYLPVFQFCENAAVRERLWRAAQAVARGSERDNTPVIRTILRLRGERARLLGKPTFADYATARTMAGSGARVLEFFTGLRDRIAPAFARDCAELTAFRDAHEPARAGAALAPWDVTFWAERLRRERVGWDSEVIRPFLPLEHIVAAMFGVARDLYGVEITEEPTWCGERGAGVEVWAPEVRFYRVERGGRHVGSFYADLFPRENKKSGAWMSGFGRPAPAGGAGPRLGAINANVTLPTATRPALLSHREAQTLFHEFGHLLHYLFIAAPYPSLDFDGLPPDFFELPSQLLENWCWDPDCLRALTRHHETGAPLPDDQIALLARVRVFRKASFYMRQLSFSAIDYRLHYKLADVPADPHAEAARAAAPYSFPTSEPSTINICDFAHLFMSPTGYAANYYSYLWSEMLEADCFLRFKRAGLRDRATGREFYEKVLSQGAQKDPAELFADFMGRAPSTDALLERAGLAAPAE